MSSENITFSFGRNWTDFLGTVGKEEVESAESDILNWLGPGAVRGKDVVDIGSGSGIHSLVFNRLGARRVHSFDYDQFSVDATRRLWQANGEPEEWTVEHGSVLDQEYLDSLGQFDIVYSWGVLHHTGEMWKAIRNCFGLVRNGGVVWIALYQEGPRYGADLALKRKYNSASDFGQRLILYGRILKIMLSRARHFKNPFAWNEKSSRGMNRYHDLSDWLGGLPYEVASEDDVVKVAAECDLIVERIKIVNEGGCSTYVFRKAT
jgi:2-polyprenyl-6-hydroxyphenyl methylase/3-demethylubiquinone-9 3-methyltransferase